MANGWTEERRKKQSELIRKIKPWKKSTGPRTAEGLAKLTARMTRHGRYSKKEKDIRDVGEMLRNHREFLRIFTELSKAGKL